MTLCPANEHLAAIASHEQTDDHVASCIACTNQIAWQRELIGIVHDLPPPPLTAAHRRELAAEVMALADAPPRDHRRVLALGALAVAAIGFVALVPRSRATAPRLDAPAAEQLVLDDRDVRQVETAADDTVELRDGELAIDTRTHAPVTIVAGRTRVTFDNSRATVVARDGVIVTAQVFAGTAEIRRDGQRHVVEAGESWTPAPSVLSLEAFRTGYEALRAKQFREAIAAFDRATDPVVAEDAQFWAAIACERAGDLDEAKRRLEAFIAQFPASPRIDDAKARLR